MHLRFTQIRSLWFNSVAVEDTWEKLRYLKHEFIRLKAQNLILSDIIQIGQYKVSTNIFQPSKSKLNGEIARESVKKRKLLNGLHRYYSTMCVMQLDCVLSSSMV